MHAFVQRPLSSVVAFRSSFTASVSRKQPHQKSARQTRSTMSTNRSDTPKFKIALCQIPVTTSKDENINTAQDYLRRAKDSEASLAVLPECFNCPYDTECFSEYAESMPNAGTKTLNPAASPSVAMLQRTAQETGMYIVGGSIPEVDENHRIYNTSLSFAPDGTILAKHRKVHLFDIDVPGRIKFTESSVLTAGDRLTVFSAAELNTTIGVSICYDLRFPEVAGVQARGLGSQLLVVPGAFNMTTGPAHWELLLRARAVDNQVFVAACSPARNEDNNGYKAWGHSLIIDPWGSVLASAQEKPDLVIADVDMRRLLEVRASVPTGKQRRTDIYELRLKKEFD